MSTGNRAVQTLWTIYFFETLLEVMIIYHDWQVTGLWWLCPRALQEASFIFMNVTGNKRCPQEPSNTWVFHFFTSFCEDVRRRKLFQARATGDEWSHGGVVSWRSVNTLTKCTFALRNHFLRQRCWTLLFRAELQTVAKTKVCCSPTSSTCAAPKIAHSTPKVTNSMSNYLFLFFFPINK